MEPIPMRELLDRYVTLRNLDRKTTLLYGMLADRLELFLGREATTADLDDLVISRYLRWRAETPAWRGQIPKPATVAKDKHMIAAAWTLAAKKKWVSEFPELPRIRVPKRLPNGRAYTTEDVEKLIIRARMRRGHTGGVPSAWWWSTLVYAAFCSGERYTALTSIRWAQVDLDRCKLVFLGETRKGQTRDIERDITPDLAKTMAAYKGQPDGLVWIWDRKSRSQWTSLKLLCRLAGVRYRGFHGFRRTAASYAALAGGRAAATRMLDHADPKMQEVYVDPVICPEERAVMPPLHLDGPPPDRPAA
jgi:integrase